MACVLCKIQHIGKAEILFNVRINNPRSDVSESHAITVYPHLT